MNQVPIWNAFLRPAATIAPRTEAFTGKTILITGAGGYIGSELARRLAPLPLKRLLLLDTTEYGLYALDRDLRASHRDLILGSVHDPAHLHELFTIHRPDITFHAAALKHVPLLETNPIPAAQTNILGTANLAEHALAFGSQLILLSTDKAVDAHSIMGATKRFAELLVLAHPGLKVVRLPNVLGSTGSVAPLFHHQIQRGEPLTVTDPETTRHFLSLGTAVDTLLHAASRPFPTGLAIPETGPAYRIEDLARFMLRQADAPQAITYTGLRPGEKLHETMTSAREHILPNPQTPNPTLLDVQTPTLPQAILDAHLTRLTTAINQRNLPALLEAIRQAVPEYQPSATLQTALQ